MWHEEREGCLCDSERAEENNASLAHFVHFVHFVDRFVTQQD
jgi:hypothetical protein